MNVTLLEAEMGHVAASFALGMRLKQKGVRLNHSKPEACFIYLGKGMIIFESTYVRCTYIHHKNIFFQVNRPFEVETTCHHRLTSPTNSSVKLVALWNL